MSQNIGRAPGVYSSEFDATLTTSSTSTTEGAFAGVYRWGPVDQSVLIDNGATYERLYHKPTNLNAETWFQGSNFLDYSDALYVVRVADTTGSANNVANTTLSAVAVPGAVAASNTVLLSSIVKNADAYEHITFDPSVNFVARYPGELGNSLKVSVCATPEAYSSVIEIVADDAVVDPATSRVAFTPGSNTAVITLNALDDVADATAAANTIAGSLNIGDVLTIDTPSGGQDVSLTAIGVPVVTGNTVTVTLGLTSPAALFEPVLSETIARSWQYARLFNDAPGVSMYQAASGNPEVVDEIHTVVVDEGGKFTGVAGSILETFGGASRATDAKLDNGQTNYLKNVINQTSSYIWFASGPQGIAFGNSSTLTDPVQPKALSISFAGGQDGLDEKNIPVGIIARGYDRFQDKDELPDVSYIIGGMSRTNALANHLISMVEKRGDCIVILSPPQNTVVNNPLRESKDMITFRSSLTSTSYAVMDGNYKLQYDPYNDVNRWVALSGDVAGILARSAAGTAPWFSPGGTTRGRIKNVVRLAWQPAQGDRDSIYRADINPIYRVGTTGPTLMGDKTLVGKNSAFSRINVRQLFVLLRKNIMKSSIDLLFEVNDEFTRAQFRNANEPLLRDIKSRRGATAYRLVCDETNNTPHIIDNNGFAGDIYVSPARSINTIQLNFVATRTGVDFSEIVGNF